MERILAQRYTASIITAFCRNHQVDSAVLPQLVGEVLATWLRLDTPVADPVPAAPVKKARRGRLAQRRDITPIRYLHAQAAAGNATAKLESAATSRVDDLTLEQAAPTLQPELVLAAEPQPTHQVDRPTMVEDVPLDRDSPDMKRHTVQSVFGSLHPAPQHGTSPEQAELPEIDPVGTRAKRTPFSKQTLRRLRS